MIKDNEGNNVCCKKTLERLKNKYGKNIYCFNCNECDNFNIIKEKK